MTEIRQREVWVDWAKVLLIYFVVIGHASLKDLPRDLIFTFHMPAFFVISGYLYHPTDWKKTTKRLLYPVLFYSIINVCFMMFVDRLKTGTIDFERYATMSWASYYTVAWPDKGYITPFVGVWFIVVLWFCRMLLGDIPHLIWIRRHCFLLALFIEVFVLTRAEVAAVWAVDIPHVFVLAILFYFSQKAIRFDSSINTILCNALVCMPIVGICLITNHYFNNYFYILLFAVSISALYYIAIQVCGIKDEIIMVYLQKNHILKKNVHISN